MVILLYCGVRQEIVGVHEEKGCKKCAKTIYYVHAPREA